MAFKNSFLRKTFPLFAFLCGNLGFAQATCPEQRTDFFHNQVRQWPSFSPKKTIPVSTPFVQRFAQNHGGNLETTPQTALQYGVRESLAFENEDSLIEMQDVFQNPTTPPILTQAQNTQVPLSPQKSILYKPDFFYQPDFYASIDADTLEALKLFKSNSHIFTPIIDQIVDSFKEALNDAIGQSIRPLDSNIQEAAPEKGAKTITGFSSDPIAKEALISLWETSLSNREIFDFLLKNELELFKQQLMENIAPGYSSVVLIDKEKKEKFGLSKKLTQLKKSPSWKKIPTSFFKKNEPLYPKIKRSVSSDFIYSFKNSWKKSSSFFKSSHQKLIKHRLPFKSSNFLKRSSSSHF